MTPSSNIERYLQRYAASPRRPILVASRSGIERVVVIPALAESRSLFATLASLAGNPASELQRSLVLCVVNNHPPPLGSEEQIADNQRTLLLLGELIEGGGRRAGEPEALRSALERIAAAPLRLGCIDASSAGAEIPRQDGGVGTARKIGMDAALTLLDGDGPGGGVICCLDADTLVMDNYLAAVHRHYATTGSPAAVAAYAHRMPAEAALRRAICLYEIFLRAYVIGLSLAGSPYAFHAIGSTMSCTADAYAAVRGMNRREAAEDFHFLDKLAKLGPIGKIGSTTLFPSARRSNRVPFGTGQRMQASAGSPDAVFRLHDVRIFSILGAWLRAIDTDPDRDGQSLLAVARGIHPELERFLESCRFAAHWPAIRRNAPDSVRLRRQFHVWFDGLRTLRLVHHLGRTAFPPRPLFEGLAELLAWAGRPPAAPAPGREARIADDLPYRTLEALRAGFPDS